MRSLRSLDGCHQSFFSRYIELFSGANMPPTQKHLTFRRVGGTGGFGGMGPRPGSLSSRGGYIPFDGTLFYFLVQCV